MPIPNDGESQSEYISRCISHVMHEGKAKDEKHAAAMCYGMWKQHKEKSLAEFSLIVRSVGLNKQTGERFWKADTSDIDPDSYNDEMTLELYKSFIDKIERGIKPPIEFRSDLWDGGRPYVSVAHYREHSIAGDTDNIYVDGKILKANGTFRDDPLGIACFNALCDDLYINKNKEKNRIRVSIAFLDFEHKHKSNGFLFKRNSLQDVCPECLKEIEKGKHQGKIFIDGLLIHFAMTRIPVNKRTLMEVDKSMATKKDDAESIVGQELAEELDEKEKSLVGKSEAVVIKADDETPESVVSESDYGKKKEDVDEDEEDEKDEKKKVKKEKSDFSFEPVLSALSELKSLIVEIKSIQTVEPEQVETPVSHPLDPVLAQLKSDFNTISLMEVGTRERLTAIQESFNAVGEEVKKLLTVPETKAEVEASINAGLLKAIEGLNSKIDLLVSQQRSVAPTIASATIPVPRSYPPSSVEQKTGMKPSVNPNEPLPVLRSLIDRSVGQ